jgi:hypothetical protein
MFRSRFDRRGGGRGATSCPLADGTQIGFTQQFTVVCNAAVDGDIIEKTTATSLLDCTSKCTDSSQRCDAVTFADPRGSKRDDSRRGGKDTVGTACFLKTNITQPEKNGPGGVDTAIAIFSDSSSNCNGLGANTTSQGGSNFGLFCSSLLPGNDLSRGFASTFQDCMNQCSSTNNCAGLTFDAGHVTGFKNCHLKTSGVGTGGNKVAGSGFDSAIVQKAAVGDVNVIASASSDISTSLAATTSVSSPTSVVVSPSTTTGDAGVAGTFTAPPSDSAGPATIINISIETVVTTVVSSFDGATAGQTVTENIPVIQGTITSTADPQTTSTSTPSLQAGNGTGTFNGNHNGSGNGFGGGGFGGFTTSHPAVVAAPVVGGMVAVIILVLLCVMRRKQQQKARNTRLLMMSKIASNGNSDAGSEGGSERVPPKPETWSWLPGMWNRRSAAALGPSMMPDKQQMRVEAISRPEPAWQGTEGREGRMERMRRMTASWRDRLRPPKMGTALSPSVGSEPDEREIGTWMTVSGGEQGRSRTYRVEGRLSRRAGDMGLR